MARGSATIEWRGDDYYVGDFIGFSAEQDPAINITHQETAVALTENYLDDRGVRVLVSTLRILATSEAPYGNVMCTHTDEGATITKDFKVFSKFKP